MSDRVFRTADSYAAEHITRNMLADYLRSRGFKDIRDERKSYGNTESQTIYAIAPDSELLAMRVRLCWRRTKDPRENTYSAAQLLSKIKNNDWEGSLLKKVEREKSNGATHYLIVQRDGEHIKYAALVPLSELVAIWCVQRDISKALIEQNKLGRRKKNHAMNGSSPTLWLQDDLAPEVAAALWDHKGVRDFASIEIISIQGSGPDDTFDDIPGIDYSLFGSDGAPVVNVTRSFIKRDQRVRKVILQRAQGRCEREGCQAARDYPGFFDVHHILKAEKSDRVWNCVALCPNCHREAHTAPNRDQINNSLLDLAMSFKKP
jgi:5-methylcytosine-specific restriction enzyme A